MKRTVRVFLIGILLGFSELVVSSSGLADQDGLGGDITMGVMGVSGQPSLLEVADDNETISGLDARPGHESAIEPYLTGSLYYHLADSGTTLFLNAGQEEGIFGAGISQLIGTAGQISATVTYGEREVWKDPYLVGSQRSKTFERTSGLTLSYEEIWGTDAFVSTTAQVVEVGDDEIGVREKELQRDGDRFQIEMGYLFALNNEITLTPILSLESNPIKGAANVSDAIGASISYGWHRDAWLFEGTVGIGSAEYQKRHPIFETTREASVYEIAATIGYAEPFSWTPMTLYGHVSYNRQDENIAFFDGNFWTTGLGIVYQY